MKRGTFHLGSCLKCHGKYSDDVIIFFNLKCNCKGAKQ